MLKEYSEKDTLSKEMRRKREGAYIGSLRLPNCERVKLFSILLSNTF